jgi:hypothetical protein
MLLALLFARNAQLEIIRAEQAVPAVSILHSSALLAVFVLPEAEPQLFVHPAHTINLLEILPFQHVYPVLTHHIMLYEVLQVWESVCSAIV